MFSAIVMIHQYLVGQVMAHLSVSKRYKFFKYILQLIERMVLQSKATREILLENNAYAVLISIIDYSSVKSN